MKLINTTIFFLAFGFVLHGCSPEPVYRLQTDEESAQEILVHRGMEYLVSELENSVAILAYYRHVGDRVIMDLEVTNYNDEMIRFYPADFSYEAHRLVFEFDEHPDDGGFVERKIGEGSALNPEEVLLNIDLQTSEAIARQRTNRVLDGISATVTAADDIVAAGRESSAGRNAREARRTRQAIERAERRENFYRNVAGLSEQRVYWETETIRTTDLTPGESIAGEISFPVHEDARIYKIYIEVGEDLHTFTYRQQSFNP